MKKKFYVFFLVMLLLVVSSCSNDENISAPEIPEPLYNHWEYVYDANNGETYTISFGPESNMFIKKSAPGLSGSTSVRYTYIHPVITFAYGDTEYRMYLGEDRITYRKDGKEYVFIGHDDHYPPLYPPTEW